MHEFNPDSASRADAHVSALCLLLYLFELERSIQMPFCSVFSCGGEGGFEEMILGFVRDKTERGLYLGNHIISRKNEWF